MTDVASLAIKVESLQVAEADRRLKGLSSSGGGAERATSGLTASFARMLGPLTAAVSVMGGLSKLVSVQRQFDVLNAGLVTATGSSEKAADAFDALQQFAQKTPYDLNQAVEGFTKLVNLGLTPSERALTSYGNTASAMGKDLNQMIEAVADAATGEFERLKEFGIKAKQEGDKVTFTFQGVKTTVGNNAAAIEEYLTKLGENQFAGAMERRMDTLDGAIANLGDTWDALFRNVSQSGVGDAIEAAVRLATDALQELNDMLASGELDAYLKSITVQFDAWGTDIQRTVDIVTKFLKDSFGGWEDEGKATVDFLIGAFKNFPSNVRALIQIMTVEVAAGLDRVMAYAGAFKDGVAAIFNDDTVAGVGQRLENRLRAIKQARTDSIDEALRERDASVKASDDQVEAAKRLRAEYDAAQEAKKKAGAGTDRLAQYKVGGDGKASAGVDKAAAKAAEQKRKQQEREFESLKESLRTEEETIAASYEKRRAIIEANTSAGSELRADLMKRLEADRSEQLKKLEEERGAELEGLRQSLRTQEDVIQESYDKRMAIIQANTAEGSQMRADLTARTEEERTKALSDLEKQRQAERDGLYNSLLTEEEMLMRSYERKRQLILDSEAVTETERQDLLKRLKQQFDDEQAASEQKRLQTQLQGGQALFEGLAGLAKTYAGEQSKTYKTLFAISKAFSITQAAMSIATGLAKAQELGWPANLAAMAQVASAGASIVSQIQGSNYSGAYDDGGQIPAGKIGIVGEYGPELVKGPAAVTGRVGTARAMQEAQGGGGEQQAAPQTNLRIVNAFDTGVIGDYMGSDAGEQVIMNIVQRNSATIRSLASGG
jgi:hypothetical protein